MSQRFRLTGMVVSLGENCQEYDGEVPSVANFQLEKSGRFLGSGEDAYGPYIMQGIKIDDVIYFIKKYHERLLGPDGRVVRFIPERGTPFYYLLVRVNGKWVGACKWQKEENFCFFPVVAVFRGGEIVESTDGGVEGIGIYLQEEWKEVERLFGKAFFEKDGMVQLCNVSHSFWV